MISSRNPPTSWIREITMRYREWLRQFQLSDCIAWCEKAALADRIHVEACIDNYTREKEDKLLDEDMCLAINAFFQWYFMLVLLPVEDAPCTRDQRMHFVFHEPDGVVEIFANEHDAATRFLEISKDVALNATSLTPTTPYMDEHDAATRFLEISKDVALNATSLTPTMPYTEEYCENENIRFDFDVVDTWKILRFKSRSERQPIVVLNHPPKLSRSRQLVGNQDRQDHNGYMRIQATEATVRSDSIIMTTEQSRVYRLVEHIVGSPSRVVLDLIDAGEFFAVQSTVAERQRRLLVDGVAGAGKTFLLGALLSKYARVQYLVKKRNFVAATMKRFERHRDFARLRACTVDAFLMRSLGIRSLPKWLRMLRDEFEHLCDLASDPALVPYVQDFPGMINVKAVNETVLFFVDEFGLLEYRLSHLLDLVLRDKRVVLVGDCNQQSAIGESSEQSIYTLLRYENICFMYDNVRAKDPRMLQRLIHFSVRTNSVACAAVDNLPVCRHVDVTSFVEAATAAQDMSELDAARRLLPRIIVNSNRSVNFLNWAIACMIWRYCVQEHSSNSLDESAFSLPFETREDSAAPVTSEPPVSSVLLRGIRYKRSVLFANENVPDVECAYESPSKRHRLLNSTICDDTTIVNDHECSIRTTLDDAFADEHFVIVGLRYRIIQASCGGALQMGSRIIVRNIESPESVIVEIDDEDATCDKFASKYRLTKCLVRPYEYNSVFKKDDICNPRFYMFPFVLDAATTVYQVQGITIPQRTYEHCYIDFYGMDDKALYVTLSRFENEDQIRGIVNKRFIR